jgi:hypothetical protein
MPRGGLSEAFRRSLDRLLLPLYVAAQAGEGDAGVIGDAAIGENLAIELAEQGAEFADRGGAAREQRKALGDRGEIALRVRRDIEQGEELEDLLGLQAGALNVQFVNGGLDVGDAAEFDADSGAAGRRLWARKVRTIA